MPNPAWFNETWFAQEKIKQMQVLGQEVPDGETPVAQLQAAIDAYNTAHANDAGFVAVTIQSNFEACNTSDYVSSVPMSAINVSPNPLFDVPTYLTSLAVKANASGYEAPGYTTGAWTAETVLKHMYEDGHMSAWEHFKASGMEQMVNPSNTFNTEAYLAARAQAMGDGATVADAIAAIKELGLNPIEDYYGFGQEHNITLTTVEPAIVPGIQDGQQWGDTVAPDEDDPYADIQATQDATKGVDHLTGEDGVNTEFKTNYGNMRADQTLGADDTFTGGANAHNTLEVTLGADWAGFNGVEVKNAETGETTTAANVTGVGRILLDHITTNTERTYTFNAKNIEGAERIDIVNHDGGTVQLQDVAKSVQEIHLTGASNTTFEHAETKEVGTVINYAKGEVAGSNDPMLLVLDGVGSISDKGVIKAAQVSSEGIEELTVKSVAGSDNYVDLSGFEDAESLVLEGAGDIRVTSVAAKGITSYDASAATGTVDINLGKIDGSTVIKGGSNLDTIHLTTGNNRFTANWTGIETLAVEKGASATIDMSGTDGALSHLWVNGGSTTLTGVKATDFTVNQTAANANVTVNGSIENFVWSDTTTDQVKAKVASNVAGNVTLNVGAGQKLGGAQFKMDDAQGAVTLNVAGASEDGKTKAGLVENTKINAEAAESFTADINGTLGSGNTFNVVGGTANQGRAVTINAADVTLGSTNTLNAKGATAVTLDLAANAGTASTGNVAINGTLDNAQTVTINLANSNTAGPDDAPAGNYAFVLDGALKSANEVTVNGDGYESAELGAMGTKDSNEALQFTASDLVELKTGVMSTGPGWNIDVNISDIANKVTLGDIKAGTDDPGNGQGDVHVTVSTTGVTTGTATSGGDLVAAGASGNLVITGDALEIDFSDVYGTIGGTNKAVELTAQSTIDYAGNDNTETVSVKGVGSGSSTFDLGGGTGVDTITFDKTSTGEASIANNADIDISLGGGADKVEFVSNVLASKAFAEVTIDLAEDTPAADEVKIAAQGSGSHLLITLENMDSTDKVTNAYKTQIDDAAKVKLVDVLEEFGIASDVDVADITAAKANGAFIYDGSVYAVDALDATVLVCLGSADEVDQSGVVTQ